MPHSKPNLALIIALFLGVFWLSGPALAASQINKTFWGGVAIKGYDPVAYFTEGRPVEGKEEFEYQWRDATWRFANQKHLRLFQKDPDKYAPQYGGYCAYAVALGDTADIDPEAWKIVDGKLYLNYDKDVQKKWEADQAEYIKKADQNWPGVIK